MIALGDKFRIRTQNHSWPRFGYGLGRVVAFLAVAGCLVTSSSDACETPVYRYAMYRWEPTPYEIYCFHKGKRDAESDRIEAKVEQVTTATDSQANVVFLPVDLGEDPELLGVPPDVKQSLLANEAVTSTEPESTSSETATRTTEMLDEITYLISTPYGVSLYRGEMDSSSIEALVDSPVRKSLAAQLETGKVGVFLFLTGSDESANEEVRNVLQGLLTDVAAGKVSLYEAPGTTGGEADEGSASPGSKYELGLIEINRQDEEEAWLVRSLLTIEPDLKKETQPMVFLTYGRARVLLPYIGPGIARENLLREVEFISGACSCTVKEQNPGVDLLVKYDWESAAAALAEKVGAEEGNESSLGEDMFFPELFIPQSTQASSEGDQDQLATNQAGVDEPGQPKQGPPTASGPKEEETAAASPEQIDEVASVSSFPTAIEASADQAFENEFGFSSLLMIGAGLLGAMVVLFGITLMVLRPQ